MVGQAWKQIIDDDGNFKNFKCPKCNGFVRRLPSGVIGCNDCNWVITDLTPAERKEIEARDPEMILVLNYLKKIETWMPSFDKNLKKCSSKDRREKRFRSKTAY